MTASKATPAPSATLSITDTARLIAMYRAMESERPDRLFSDPYARLLAGARGEEVVGKLRIGRMLAMPNIVRTHVIDELIQACIGEDKVDLIINLAAGLDARPYRMELPTSLTWIEVDYAEIIDYKSTMLGGATPRCRLERFSADLSDGQTRRDLLTRFGALRKKALVITEGLLVYLGADQSAELAKDLAAQPTFALWIVDIIAPFLLRILRRMARSSMSGSAELRFAPAEGAAFFAPYGWRLRVYRSSMIEGRRFNREGPGAWIGWLLFPRAARSELGRHSGPMTGTLLMERSVSQS